MITSVQLVDYDAGTSLTLVPNPNITITALDLGFPEIRAVTESRTADNGDRDTTALHGPRGVSISAELYNTPAALADQWRSFLAPSARPCLVVTDTEWSGPRRIMLRTDQWSDPIAEGADDIYRAVQAQWKAPDGIWESPTLTEVTIVAQSSTSTGISMPVSFPLTFPNTSPTGQGTIVNTGPVPVHFTARLYGPCDGPVLTHSTLGALIFKTAANGGLAVNAGEYVEIDTRERTAYYLSNPGSNRLNAIDWVNSTWWTLAPGTNLITYNPASVVVAGAQAVIDYRATGL